MIRGFLSGRQTRAVLVVAAGVVAAIVPASAAPRHDSQRVVVRTAASVGHDRAPCPGEALKTTTHVDG